VQQVLIIFIKMHLAIQPANRILWSSLSRPISSFAIILVQAHSICTKMALVLVIVRPILTLILKFTISNSALSPVKPTISCMIMEVATLIANLVSLSEFNNSAYNTVISLVQAPNISTKTAPVSLNANNILSLFSKEQISTFVIILVQTLNTFIKTAHV